jgi:carbon storage regulator CsrA
MLVLARRLHEKIFIDVAGVRIEVSPVTLDHGKVRLGFSAPKDVVIMREEIADSPERKAS